MIISLALSSIISIGFLSPAASPVAPHSLTSSPAIHQDAKDKIVWVCPGCGQQCDNVIHDKPGLCETCGMKLIKKTAEEMKTLPFKGNGTVLVFLFPGVDIIDFSGPWEAFGMAHYNVYTVAAKAGPLHTSYAQTITPDYTFDNCPKPDILLLPGGNVTNIKEGDPTMTWIRKESAEAKYTMSVCVGAYWLAQAGLLDGKEATTMRGMTEGMQKQFPKIQVQEGKRFVDAGNIITTGGLYAGIDGAFHLIEKIHGEKFAADLAKGGEYAWPPKQ